MKKDKVLLDFDPNEACGDNGNYFGFPYKWEDAPLVLVSVPWDVTVSYRAGASLGPEAIRRASVQLDFFDFEIAHAWKLGIGTYPFSQSEDIAELSRQMRPVAEKLIAFEEGRTAGYTAAARKKDRDKLEDACLYANVWLSTLCERLLAQGKRVAVVGGDHSVPLGLIQALAKIHGAGGEEHADGGFGILHFDAHDDLRRAYEGFTYSHASIMYNALQIPAVERLVQVGVRDVCQNEQDFVAEQNALPTRNAAPDAPARIRQFPDTVLQKRLFEGETWKSICTDIIASLPQKVYISFDIDALEPALCPHTGTPVPGGLTFAQVRYLLGALRQSGKEIIGFDLCEAAPNPADPTDEWDGNVGARVLYMLCNTLLSTRL